MHLGIKLEYNESQVHTQNESKQLLAAAGRYTLFFAPVSDAPVSDSSIYLTLPLKIWKLQLIKSSLFSTLSNCSITTQKR
jgi:hypothetical protein